MYWAHTLRLTVSAETADSTLQAHRAYQKELLARGALRQAWILDAGDGFLEILETPDRRAAEAIAEASPLIVAGMVAWSMVPCTALDFCEDTKLEVADPGDVPDS